MCRPLAIITLKGRCFDNGNIVLMHLNDHCRDKGKLLATNGIGINCKERCCSIPFCSRLRWPFTDVMGLLVIVIKLENSSSTHESPAMKV